MSNSSPQIAPGISIEREPVTNQDLAAVGVDLALDFPGSSAADFARYPVLSEGGWFMVIKHRPTLQSVSRTPWDLFGPVRLNTYGLSFD